MLVISRATWLKETPRSAQPSRITVVKEQQCGECRWNVTSVSVGRVAPDNWSRLQQSGDMSVSVSEGPEKAIPDIQQLVQILLRQRDFEKLMRRHSGARYRRKSAGTCDQPVEG
jgi:hypothetical protein